MLAQRRLMVAVGVFVLCLAILFALWRISYVVTFPLEELAMDPRAAGVGVAAHELLGRKGPTDLVVDYASASAMSHGRDAYGIGEVLIHDLNQGEDWGYAVANPHPPTVLPIVLPLTLIKFNRAGEIWAFAMMLAYIATIALAGVRWPLAVAAGIGLAVTMPGAYGASNVVPLIGLGVALAYRYRDIPWLAGLAIALAAAPKWSGLVLLVPFVLSGRFKAAVWTVGFYAALAAIPLAFQPSIWTRYLHAGVAAIAAVQARPDNGSLLQFAQHWNAPELLVLGIIGGAALVLVLASRDTFWPTIWLMVALLPIAWTYSMLTLLPIAAHIVSRRPTPIAATALLMVAAALTLGSAPSGTWPTVTIPVIVTLVYAAILAAPCPESDFSLNRIWTRLASIRSLRVQPAPSG